MILSYNPSTSAIRTEAGGDVTDRAARPADEGPKAYVDPQSRLIAFHLYQAQIKVIPLESVVSGKQPMRSGSLGNIGPPGTSGKGKGKQVERRAIGEVGEAWSQRYEL